MKKMLTRFSTIFLMSFFVLAAHAETSIPNASSSVHPVLVGRGISKIKYPAELRAQWPTVRSYNSEWIIKNGAIWKYGSISQTSSSPVYQYPKNLGDAYDIGVYWSPDSTRVLVVYASGKGFDILLNELDAGKWRSVKFVDPNSKVLTDVDDPPQAPKFARWAKVVNVQWVGANLVYLTINTHAWISQKVRDIHEVTYTAKLQFFGDGTCAYLK
jgi:hypothetical protein